MLSRLDDAQVRYIMFQILLNLVSKRAKMSSLWYHTKFALCNLMSEYRIPYTIYRGQVCFAEDPVPIKDLLEVYDDRLVKFLVHSVSKKLYMETSRSNWETIKEYVEQAGETLMITQVDLRY